MGPLRSFDHFRELSSFQVSEDAVKDRLELGEGVPLSPCNSLLFPELNDAPSTVNDSDVATNIHNLKHLSDELIPPLHKIITDCYTFSEKNDILRDISCFRGGVVDILSRLNLQDCGEYKAHIGKAVALVDVSTQILTNALFLQGVKIDSSTVNVIAGTAIKSCEDHAPYLVVKVEKDKGLVFFYLFLHYLSTKKNHCLNLMLDHFFVHNYTNDFFVLNLQNRSDVILCRHNFVSLLIYFSAMKFLNKCHLNILDTLINFKARWGVIGGEGFLHTNFYSLLDRLITNASYSEWSMMNKDSRELVDHCRHLQVLSYKNSMLINEEMDNNVSLTPITPLSMTIGSKRKYDIGNAKPKSIPLVKRKKQSASHQQLGVDSSTSAWSESHHREVAGSLQNVFKGVFHNLSEGSQAVVIRDLKPADPVAANLLAESSTSKSRGDNNHLFVGLPNLGNTCYMNSCVQLLESSCFFRNFLNTSSPISGALSALVDAVDDKESRREKCRKLRDQLFASGHPEFQSGKYAQKDAAACLQAILENIGYCFHTQTVVIRSKGLIAIQSDPVIDPRQILALGINEGDKQLQAMLENEFAPQNVEDINSEVLEKDSKINAPSNSVLVTQLGSRAPGFVVIQVKRYKIAHTRVLKNSQAIQIEGDIITLSFSGVQVSYKLKGFIKHIGRTPSDGHYVAFGEHNSSWFCCDDAVVRAVNLEEKEASKENAYVLIFDRI